ncbi:MAG: AAA family ATPase, partial [Methanothrix sp.]|nr:AAA family ATPase [Methanothrix sp.]
MKIVICGKGGCGKSTVSALMAREMTARGDRVLVVDTDE